MSRKFAVFDIDGTLIRWQLYHAISDQLIKDGHFQTSDFSAVKQARLNWKKRQDPDAFKTYEQALVEAYDTGIIRVSHANFLASLQRAFEQYKQQSYTYTRELIASLKDQGYLLFAISASQKEVVELIAKEYGFDDFGGSEYAVTNGQFTGKKYVLRRSEKPLYLQKLIDKHGAGLEGSIGVGDSDSDIPMLRSVKQPIAFNPDQKLLAYAKEHKWKVVVERKNVIYELEEHDGQYLLA